MDKSPICIEIGDMPILIESEQDNLRRILRDRYAGFLRSGSADRRLSIRVRPILSNEENQDDADLRVEREDERWYIRRGDFKGEWDSSRHEGWVEQTANPYSLDTALRIIHSLELAQQGGFLLHASSAVRNGRAFLFSGVSGAGKTTIARLAPADVVLLTDEMSYIRPNCEAFRAYGTPFAGELAQPGENISAPVAGIYLLAKASENCIEDVPAVEAVRSLLRNVLFLAHDARLSAALLDTACRVVRSVPVRRLSFVPDERVWDLIN